MAKCWEQRGCDEDMQATCPHPVDFKDNCPTKCAFSTCDNPQYGLTTDPELVFTTEVDRTQAVKDGCFYCEFFLRHGPKLK